MISKHCLLSLYGTTESAIPTFIGEDWICMSKRYLNERKKEARLLMNLRLSNTSILLCICVLYRTGSQCSLYHVSDDSGDKASLYKPLTKLVVGALIRLCSSKTRHLGGGAQHVNGTRPCSYNSSKADQREVRLAGKRKAVKVAKPKSGGNIRTRCKSLL